MSTSLSVEAASVSLYKKINLVFLEENVIASTEAIALKDDGDSPQVSRYVSSIFMWIALVSIISTFWHNKYGERSASADNKDLDHKEIGY